MSYKVRLYGSHDELIDDCGDFIHLRAAEDCAQKESKRFGYTCKVRVYHTIEGLVPDDYILVTTWRRGRKIKN